MTFCSLRNIRQGDNLPSFLRMPHCPTLFSGKLKVLEKNFLVKKFGFFFFILLFFNNFLPSATIAYLQVFVNNIFFVYFG